MTLKSKATIKNDLTNRKQCEVNEEIKVKTETLSAGKGFDFPFLSFSALCEMVIDNHAVCDNNKKINAYTQAPFPFYC